MRRRRDATGKTGIEIAEEAVLLLRRAPAGVTAAYFVGTLPFVLGFLYFWSDMSRGAFAYGRCADAALGVSLLFLWMKCWHSVFCAMLRARVEQRPEPSWSLRRVGRLVFAQTVLQPLGLLAIPASMLIAVPLGWVHAFYQNVTVCASGDEGDLAAVRDRAWRLAQLWPFQNHIVMWLMSPWFAGAGLLVAFGAGWMASAYYTTTGYVDPFSWFLTGSFLILVFIWPTSPLGFVLAINAALLMIFVPGAVKSLLGVESVFTLSSAYSVVNTTFLAALYGVVYLCMDPFLKAAHVLRCFYGESVVTGDDLKIELRNLRAGRAILLAVLGLFLCAAPVLGKVAVSAGGGTAVPPPAETAIAPSELDRVIQEVLQREEFRWRMPRINPEENAPKKAGLLSAFFDSVGDVFASVGRKIGRFMGKVFRWLNKYFFSLFRWNPEPAKESSPWDSSLYPMLFVVMAVVLSTLAILLWRNRRQRGAEAGVTAQPVLAVDLESDQVSADHLPADEWMTMAADLLKRGEFRLAVRALFLSSLAHLAQSGAIQISSFKSNRDYQRDLERKSHALPDLFAAFRENVTVFDRIWYGRYPATEETVRGFESNLQRIRSHGVEQ